MKTSQRSTRHLGLATLAFGLMTLVAACVPAVVDEEGNQVELSIASGTLTIAVGESLTLNAAPVTKNGRAIAGLYTMAWTTADSSTAKISPSGQLTGVAPGSTTITATVTLISSGATISATAPVTVGGAAPPPTPDLANPPSDLGTAPDLATTTTTTANGTRSTLTFNAIPYSDPEIMGPGRGAEDWQGNFNVDVPTEGAAKQAFNYYERHTWTQLEGAQGAYTWTRIDAGLKQAIDRHQRYGFGIMTVCTGCDPFNGPVTFDNGAAVYPQYLHTLMQAEAVKDWKTTGSGATTGTGDWIPNWNSPAYLSRFEALLVALNQHLETGSYNGVKYKDVISYIDVRGYGNWGEWHSAGIVDTMSQYPTGTRATDASLIRIIDAFVNGFPSYPLVVMVAAFDHNFFQNTMNSPAVGYHALTAKNGYGLLGWRRDQWGALDSYLREYTDLNTTTVNGLLFSTAILERYKSAPVVGEPCCATDYSDLETQVRRYHAASFGNGNYGVSLSTAMKNNIRAASKAAGYRLVLEGGSYTSAVASDRALGIALDWKNVGVAPTYESWDVVFELRTSGGAVVWSGTSSFKPKLFSPQATATRVEQAFVLPAGIAAGTYSLRVTVRDPKAYMAPLPLAITGRQADGSYVLGNVAVP